MADHDRENSDLPERSTSEPPAEALTVRGPRWRALIPIASVAVIAVAGVQFMRESDRAGYRAFDTGKLLENPRPEGAESTGGRGPSGPTAATTGFAGSVLYELGLTSGDSQELAGRRVSFTIPTGATASDGAFWVGSGNEALLVVPRRDRRSGEDRNRGEPSEHGVVDTGGEGTTSISGTIQRVPHAEAMHSWSLTHTDIRRLRARGVFLSADTITQRAGTEDAR